MAQTVLVADNSIASQRLFEMVLTREGYHVITVDSAKDVLARVKERRPDLALIDAIMPETDGYQLCKTLKTDPQYKNLPVIMLGGIHEDFDQSKGAKIVGANAILNKPAKSQVILSKIREFLQTQKQRQPAQKAVKAVPKAEEYAEVIQEPPFVEEEYEFDEESEEADMVVESEILEEEAEWEEGDEGLEEATATINEYEEAPAFLPDEEAEAREEVAEEYEAVSAPAPSVPQARPLDQLTLSEENLDRIAEEIVTRLSGRLAPVLMQSLMTYVLQLPSVKQIVDNASKDLIKQILPDLQGKLKK